MRSKGLQQLLFDLAMDEARRELEAFWVAYIGLLIIIDAVRPGIDADSDLMP